MRKQTKLDVFYGLVQSEFLRYSDLRGRSRPSGFWSLAGSFAAYVFFLLAIDSLVLVQVLSGEILGVVFWVLAAPLVLTLVPLISAWFRRANDTQPVRRFDAWINNFSSNSRISQRVIQVVVVVVLALIAAALALNFMPALVATLLIIAALPSDAVVQRKGPNASRSTTALLPPPPPSSTFSPSAPPVFAPVTASYPPSFAGTNQSPSKDLKKRVWFWISVLVALLLVLLALFPTLFSDIERSFKRVTEPTQSVQPTETPTPIVSPSEGASSLPSEAPTKGSSSVGGGVGDSEDDDDMLVVPVTPGDDKDEVAGLDPRFRYCTHAIAAGYGPYYNGVDPEYAWYNDRDGDGAVCER